MISNTPSVQSRESKRILKIIDHFRHRGWAILKEKGLGGLLSSVCKRVRRKPGWHILKVLELMATPYLKLRRPGVEVKILELDDPDDPLHDEIVAKDVWRTSKTVLMRRIPKISTNPTWPLRAAPFPDLIFVPPSQSRGDERFDEHGRIFVPPSQCRGDDRFDALSGVRYEVFCSGHRGQLRVGRAIGCTFAEQELNQLAVPAG